MAFTTLCTPFQHVGCVSKKWPQIVIVYFVHFYQSFSFFKLHNFQGNPGRTLHEAQLEQVQCAKQIVICLNVHNCMTMSEKTRDNLISSGPARFGFLSAFHPSFTSRQVHYLGQKLSISFPTDLFEVICKLEIVMAHLKKFPPFIPTIQSRTSELKIYCKSFVSYNSGCFSSR